VRLFVAIALDPAVRERIAAEQQRLVSVLGTAATSLRLVAPDRLHLTLAFIGEVEDSRGAAIAGRFAVDIEQPRFTLMLGGAGVFPARGESRVLWLGLVGGADHLTVLQERVVRRLTGSGVAVDRRRFSPHLTLGRWRAGQGRVRLAPDGRAATSNAERRTTNRERRTKNVEPAIARVVVNEVTLFESRLAAAGSAYTALAIARLSCHSSS
jgi:RNA 2',3'-cyclic 3'-phosphodiesterase